MKIQTISLAFLTTAFLASPIYAQDTAAEAKPKTAEELALEASQQETARLATANALADEKLKTELATLRAEIARIKVEKEAIAERLALQALKADEANQARKQQLKAQSEQLALEVGLEKVKTDRATQAAKLESLKRKEELEELKHYSNLLAAKKKRDSFADKKPVYLDKPLQDNGTLIISDRRIALNGPISYFTASYITERLSYYNNKNSKQPIFIVIDSSPGGSVMAGYRILKAMEASDAPVHVVVKSFAASMAAGITTLAEESYAYPNAIILHHQLSATVFARLNLTEQREFFEESQKWWKRLATPVAEKMGVSLEEFVKMMYKNTSSGDWAEFGDRAKELKWVNHIVPRIVETSLLENPDTVTVKKKASHNLKESLDEDGLPVMYLPRPIPRDRYYLYNPDKYYRLR